MKSKLEQLQNIFGDTKRILGSKKSIHDVAPIIPKILGTILECEWGTFWLVNTKSQKLCPIGTWHAPTVSALALEQDTLGRELTLSEGNAGHVWSGRQPIWTINLIQDMCLPRSLDANDAGFQGGIWFAIKTDEIVYGVIELLSRKLPTPTEQLLQEIERLGNRLGHLIDDRELRRL